MRSAASAWCDKSASTCDISTMDRAASPSDPADAELILRAARGDAEAFAQLFDRRAPAIRAWLRLQTRDPHAAADLLSATFARAWQHRSRFRDRSGGSAAPWLFGIARHLLADWRHNGRVEQAARHKLGMELSVQAAEPLAAFADELTPELAAALEALPPGQRAALELRVLQELDYPAVASRLASSEGSARNRVHRALCALRAAFEGGQP